MTADVLPPDPCDYCDEPWTRIRGGQFRIFTCRRHYDRTDSPTRREERYAGQPTNAVLSQQTVRRAFASKAQR